MPCIEKEVPKQILGNLVSKINKKLQYEKQ